MLNVHSAGEAWRWKRRTDMRAVMKGVMYVLSTSCQWRYLPKDFPPRSTFHNYFIWWQCDGVLDRIHHALYVECREKAAREASPTACIIDSQSVKSAEKGGPASIRTGLMRAADQGHEATHSRRYAGSIAAGIVHSPGIQDRDGGTSLLATLFGQFPLREAICLTARTKGRFSLTRSPNSCLASKPKSSNDPTKPKGFVRLPKRSIVERTTGGSIVPADSPRIGNISSSAVSLSWVIWLAWRDYALAW